jgi:hypothetical protein
MGAIENIAIARPARKGNEAFIPMSFPDKIESAYDITFPIPN